MESKSDFQYFSVNGEFLFESKTKFLPSNFSSQKSKHYDGSRNKKKQKEKEHLQLER